MNKDTALADITVDPKKIKALRKSLKLTQDELAKKIGTQGSAISRMERNPFVPRIATLKKLCKLFNVTPEELSEDSTTKTVTALSKANQGLNFLMKTFAADASTKEEMMNAIDMLISMIQDLKKSLQNIPEEFLKLNQSKPKEAETPTQGTKEMKQERIKTKQTK